jgi:hypothetical protein
LSEVAICGYLEKQKTARRPHNLGAQSEGPPPTDAIDPFGETDARLRCIQSAPCVNAHRLDGGTG